MERAEEVEDVDAAHPNAARPEEDAVIGEDEGAVVQEETVVRAEGGEDKEVEPLMDFHQKSCRISEKEV